MASNSVKRIDYPDKRMSKGALDEHYVSAYLDSPMDGKTAAMRKAMEAIGMDSSTANRMRAWEIHHRLQDKIEEALIRVAKDSRAIGLRKLLQLCEHADSQNVQLSAATTLTRDLFPNVSVSKTMDITDIDKKLKALEDEINNTVDEA